ncbi:MAG: SEL1-like repeat protein [Rhodobiaceae bacterium]|nr:SEL1-like repeat protein [Rhodobiaceae bacterium]MCC0054000.1 SEL1-like repeat protein [Rhodobiaceae bacterium]
MAYSSARKQNIRRAARAAARDAGMSLEEWIDTVFDPDEHGADFDTASTRGNATRPAADDRTATRLLAHRLDAIEALLADKAERGHEEGHAEGDALIRELEAAIAGGRKGTRGMAGGLARVIGEDLPISRNAASGALREIGKRLDGIASGMAAARKAPAPGEAAIARLENRLDAIAKQLDARAAAPQEAPKRGADDAIAAQTRRLEDKLDAMSRQLASAPRPVAHARLASTPRSQMVPTPETDMNRRLSGIDDAVSQILKRQKALDQIAPTAKPDDSRKAEVDVIRTDIARLAQRLEGASVQLGRNVEQRLANLSGQLDTATRGELTAIRAEISQLAKRVDEGTRKGLAALHETLTGMAQMNKPVDLDRIENKLIEIAAAVSEATRGDDGIGEALAGRLDELTRRVEDLAEIGGGNLTADSVGSIERQLADLSQDIRECVDASPQALQAIATQFDRMNTRLDALAARDEGAGVDILSERIEQLFDRIGTLGNASSTDPAVLREIQSRLDEIAERPVAATTGIDSDAFNALEQRIGTLAEQLEALTSKGPDNAPQALAELATQVARLGEMVEASERKRPATPNIDQAMGELVRRVESVQNSTVEAARRAAEEVVASLDRGGSADSMLFNNLKHELNALRSASQSSNERTEHTLSVMRDVLTTIVERLSEMEAEEPGRVARMAAGRDAGAERYALSPTAAAALAEDPEAPEPASESPMGWNGSLDMAPQPEMPAADIATGKAGPPVIDEPAGDMTAANEPLPVGAELEATDIADFGVPDSGAADMHPMPNADAPDFPEGDMPLQPGAERQVQPPRRQKPDPIPASERASDADRQDFIAAARRAAQKAAAEADAQSIDGGKGKAGPLGRARKPLVIISAALILVVGSLKLYNMVFAPESAPEEPAAESSSMPADLPQAIPAAPAGADAVSVPADQGAPAADGAPADAGTASAAPESPAAAAEPAMEAAPVAPVDATPQDMPASTAPAEEPGDTPAPASDGGSPDVSAAPAATPRVVEMTTNSIGKGPRLDVAGTLDQTAAMQASLNQLPQAIGSDSLRRAAVDGNAVAQFEIASRFTQGRGVAQDLKAAADWYQRAAAQGLAPAQYRLGSLYEKGHGVTRDMAMAEMWYLRAADQGNRKAMHNLAVLNAQGAKGEPNFAEAARWFRQAAEHGLRDSQFNLGILYARGLGIEADQKEAYKWFAIAAAQGDKEAESKRDEIANSLNTEDQAVAKRMARNWQATPLVEDANFIKSSAEWDKASMDEALDPKIVVRAAQTMLNQLGFDAGPADGLMGPRTRDAIKEFQSNSGQIPTGIATPELLTSLKKATG